jgi:YD repeat-containing protein
MTPSTAPTGLPNRPGPNISPTTQTLTYGCDKLYRLTSASGGPAGATSYTYDPVGNRLIRTRNSVTTTYAYDRADRITSAATPSSGTSYTVNAVGNMTVRGSDTLAYDQANRLTQTTVGTITASYAYDGDGNRRSKTSGGQTTTYVNDARGLSQVLQATTGSTVVSYVPGLAQHDSSKPTEAAKWGYTLSDAQNARLLVDGAGTLAHRWEWEPFGRARADQGTTTAAFSYGGEQQDDLYRRLSRHGSGRDRQPPDQRRARRDRDA